MTATRRRLALIAAAAGMAAMVAACSSPSTPAPSASSSSGSQVTVFAAASLTASFTEIGRQFEARHPGTTVRFNFAGSSDLVAQLQQGAPADVFASADTANMDKATGAGLVSGSPTSFATNSMMIAVPPENPAKVASFADLTEPSAQVVVCAPEVPCGAATTQVERNTGVTLKPVSEESSVTDVLNKVTTGEADAGIVYLTDVQGSAGGVQGIAIPAKDNAVNTYPIGVLTGSASPALAQEFEALVVGPQGQQVLADAGFGGP
jgi:molybdate transport system substrate-binding protein